MADLLEDRLQYACAEYLRFNKICFFHVPNEGKRSIQGHARMIAKGLQAGVHDLVILLDGGVTLWVELKTKKGVISKHQKTWHERIVKMGYHHLVLKSDCVLEILEGLEAFLLAHLPDDQKCNVQSAKTFLLSRPQLHKACAACRPSSSA